ncbi:MAG: DUF2461 domain-containing protein [Bacteroidales bacterium]|nr:DUF2461 domain-containing protein [Bacteroidales bacterium]
MISKPSFSFLNELKYNNYKEWFDENRSTYLAARKEFENLVNLAIGEISMFDKKSAQTTAKASIFRINRDIRFSNDKSPYKTNMGAYIAQGGKKSIFAGYYIHFEPGACFLSGGIYMPSGAVLKALRHEIFENMDEFKAIIEKPSFIKHFGRALWGEKLKTAPKGFPKEFIDLEYLKFKHYTVVKNEPDRLYQSNALIKEIQEVFTEMYPFNKFLNRTIEESAT